MNGEKVMYLKFMATLCGVLLTICSFFMVKTFDKLVEVDQKLVMIDAMNREFHASIRVEVDGVKFRLVALEDKENRRHKGEVE
jgi:hypothetical protein